MESILKLLKINILKSSGDNYIARCPFHKDGKERHPSFGINKNTGVFNCFTCGSKGNLVHLISALTGMNEHEAIKLLEKQKVYDILNHAHDEVSISVWADRYKMENGIQVLNDNILDLYDEENDYLMNRGIYKVTMREWEIGYDRWMKRVTFPVRDARGRLLGICGRATGDVQPRYFFYDGFSKGGVLYGLHKLRLPDDKLLIIVEGLVDVLWLWQAGFENSLAIMGSQMTEKQANIVASLSKNVLIWLDNDSAGESGKDRVTELLANRAKLFYVDWEQYPHTDPHEFLRAEIEEIIENKKYYLIELLSVGR